MKAVAAIRVLIKAIRQALVQRADFLGRYGESFTDRELFGHYGFASHPLPGAEGVTVFINGDVNNAIVIATEDRRYRLTLQEGEAALYDDQGSHVHLKRDGIVEIAAPAKIIYKAPLHEIWGQLVTKDANGGNSGSATINGPLTVNGETTVDGSINATGDVIDGGHNTNHHSHP